MPTERSTILEDVRVLTEFIQFCERAGRAMPPPGCASLNEMRIRLMIGK